MNRLLIGAFTATCAAVLLSLAGGVGTAAPVPKGAGQNDPTPDLKVFFDTVGKAVKDEKWPTEADEKRLKDTARVTFERMLKVAEQKERKLPVDFDKLTKLDVAGEYKGKSLDSNLLITGEVRVTGAKNSVIFVSGDVQLTGATNCVIVAKNVRCTGVENCVIIAGEFIRLTSARRNNGSDPSVLIAGQWIRTTGMDGTICHVIRPSGLPAPDEVKFAGKGPHPAIRVTSAENVIFLNDRNDTSANGPKNCAYLPQKTPIAK